MSYTFKKSYVKGRSFFGPEGLSKKEKEVFISGKLPRKVKVQYNAQTFNGTDNLLKAVLGYEIDRIINIRRFDKKGVARKVKGGLWFVYKLPRNVPQKVGL